MRNVAAMTRFTFICGCGHSGTTLLATMFAARDDTWVPLRETNLFLDPATAPALWEAFGAEVRGAGKAHVAEKTPRHLHAIDRIRDMVPGARFLVMVRAGRDIAASFVKRHGSADRGRRRWLHDNAIVMAEEAASDVMVIRYEDLVADPGSILRAACAFVGLSFAPDRLDCHRKEHLWFGVDTVERGDGTRGEGHRALRNWQVNPPMFDDRGKWRRVLREDDIAKFRKPKAARMLRHFGYDAAAAPEAGPGAQSDIGSIRNRVHHDTR